MDAVDLIPMNPRDYLILFCLAQGERHGYGIVREVEQESGGRVRIDAANLYRSLKRMTHEGLVTESDVGDEEPSRRKYYRLTALGRQAVELEADRLARLTEVARERALIPETESGA